MPQRLIITILHFFIIFSWNSEENRFAELQRIKSISFTRTLTSRFAVLDSIHARCEYDHLILMCLQDLFDAWMEEKKNSRRKKNQLKKK